MDDTLELFGEKLEQLRNQWQEIRASITPQQTRKIEQGISAIFSTVTDAIRAAALIAPERRLSPIEIQRRCLVGLSEILLD